jgi:AcrR family transcriptional regulator
MNRPRPQGGVAARTENKLKRRQNILKQASYLIASEGYRGFTLSQLASKSNVTVPTIHNLIGNKTELCKKLVEEMIERTGQILFKSDIDDPIIATEHFIDGLLSLYKEDEDFYKAAFIIGEHEHLFEHRTPDGIFRKSLDLAHQLCVDGKENGYLLGDVDSLVLADKLFANQRLARHDWVHGYIDLDEYRYQVLTGMFLTFASDAAAPFRKKLIERVCEIQEHEESSFSLDTNQD